MQRSNAKAAHATIWLANIAGLADSQVEGWASELGPGERLRHGAFVRQARRHQFVAGRRLLRRALATSAGVPESALRVEERAAMAPLVTVGDGRRPLPFFSISHSGSWVACAISHQAPVGLDIELLDPTRDTDALARQVFGDGAAAELASLPEPARHQRFFALWSAKEARFKLGQPDGACYAIDHPSLALSLCSAVPLRAAPDLQLITL